MHATWIYAILLIAPLSASEHMKVSVCTQGRLTGSAVSASENHTAALFHAIGIDIDWSPCESAPIGDEAIQQHWFTIRLRDDRPPGTPDSASLDTLGQAFFSEDQAAYVADVYYTAGQSIAAHQQVESTLLMACVMAHELGHLLLGPGHGADGIMRAGWDSKDLDAIRKGWLRFAASESARMHRALL